MAKARLRPAVGRVIQRRPDTELIANANTYHLI